jgi:hypothetical protein
MHNSQLFGALSACIAALSSVSFATANSISINNVIEDCKYLKAERGSAYITATEFVKEDASSLNYWMVSWKDIELPIPNAEFNKLQYETDGQTLLKIILISDKDEVSLTIGNGFEVNKKIELALDLRSNEKEKFITVDELFLASLSVTPDKLTCTKHGVARDYLDIFGLMYKVLFAPTGATHVHKLSGKYNGWVFQHRIGEHMGFEAQINKSPIKTSYTSYSIISSSRAYIDAIGAALFDAVHKPSSNKPEWLIIFQSFIENQAEGLLKQLSKKYDFNIEKLEHYERSSEF